MSVLTVIKFFFLGHVLYQETWWQRLPTDSYRDLSKCEMLLFRSKLKHLVITEVTGVENMSRNIKKTQEKSIFLSS